MRGAYVVAAEQYNGANLVGSLAFFGATAEEALARYEAAHRALDGQLQPRQSTSERRSASTLGAPEPPHKCTAQSATGIAQQLPGAPWIYERSFPPGYEIRVRSTGELVQFTVKHFDVQTPKGPKNIPARFTPDGVRLVLQCPHTGEQFVFYHEAQAFTADALGAAAGDALVWQEEYPDASGDFAFKASGRYAVLASVSLNYSLAQVVAKVNATGFSVTYSWEQGTPTRGSYAVDDWLAALPKDPTDNHRWVYGEANVGSSDTTLNQTPPWPLTVYRIAHVLVAVPAPAPGPGGPTPEPPLPSPTDPGCPPVPSLWPSRVGGAVAGAGAVLLYHVIRAAI